MVYDACGCALTESNFRLSDPDNNDLVGFQPKATLQLQFTRSF
jgi:hypothetical protein